MGPTKGWPLAGIVRILTSEDTDGEETSHGLREILVRSGLVTILGSYTQVCELTIVHRFGWANGMFGQRILGLENRMPHLMDDSYQ